MCRLRTIIKQSQSQKYGGSNEAMILLCYCHQSQTTMFFSGRNIFIKHWDKKNQCVKRAYPGHAKLNMYLSKYRQKVDDIINSALAEDVNPTTQYVKDLYNGRKVKKEIIKTVSFWEFVDQYMKNAQVRLSPNTIKSYKTSIKNLESFEKYSRTKMNFDTIDLSFYHDYMEYYTGYLQLKNSGFGKVIKLLKSVLNSATELGHNTNLIYKSKSFKVHNEQADNIYLNEKELQRIIELDFSNNKTLRRVRDLFYLGCYTGLRFSDYCQITLENIIGNTLHVKTQKTGKAVIIPLAEEAMTLIESYNGDFPKPMTNQVMNRYLKKIGQLAKIDGAFNTYHTTGSNRIKQTFKKWELIRTHTARRSYATNMYLRGLEPSMIMAVTGHSNEKVFRNYIKISSEENAQRMLKLLSQKQSA